MIYSSLPISHHHYSVPVVHRQEKKSVNTMRWNRLVMYCPIAACGIPDFSFAQSPDPPSRLDVVTLQNGSLIYVWRSR